MKTKHSLLLALLMLGGNVLMAQGFLEPANGKAHVYIVSLKKKSMNFEFFLNDKYIGILGKNNYLLLACDAGKNLIWASSESKYFVEAELQAGETYAMIVETTTGFWRNNPKLVPVMASDAAFQAAATLIKSKPPMVTDQKKVDKMNKDMTKFIPQELENYNTKLKKEVNFPIITPGMKIPAEALK